MPLVLQADLVTFCDRDSGRGQPKIPIFLGREIAAKNFAEFLLDPLYVHIRNGDRYSLRHGGFDESC